MTEQAVKLTKGQRAALRMIAAGDCCFQKTVAGKIEALGLAVPLPTLMNMLVGCNTKDALHWRLTIEGAQALAA